MALFGKKRSEGAESNGEAPAFSPDKAAKFFEHARTAHESTNYEYAMSTWLNGLRQDPSSMEGLAGFFSSAAAWRNAAGGSTKGPSKDTAKAVAGSGGGVDRYLAALLATGAKADDPGLAVKAAELAAKLGLREPAARLGERAIMLVSRAKKPRKDQYVSLMKVFSAAQSFEMAAKAGERAVAMDPTDAKLADQVRNLAAEATMSRSGFDQIGQEGGFRANIRDAAKQQALEEEDRIVKTEDTLERIIERRRAEYEERPEDNPSITRYVKALVDRGTPEDEAAAIEVLEAAYERTDEFRFRQMVGDIRMRAKRRELAPLKKKAGRPDATPEDIAEYERAAKEVIGAEIPEFEVRVKAYPTDLPLRMELGRRYFDTERYEEAVGQLQEARNDARNRARAMRLLGVSFHKMGWFDESVDTLRQAIEETSDPEGEAARELRYALLVALQARAEDQRELGDAEEAYKLASTIAMQQISFRDIRERRESIKSLVSDLKQAAHG